MEKLLYYVWTHRLWDGSDGVVTTTGQSIEVIDVGRRNDGMGPDFFNAKVKIGDKVWAGNVEVHVHASDWHKHCHSDNKAYDSVILHVVSHPDVSIFRSTGEEIPTLVISCPETLIANYEFLLHTTQFLPCGDRLHEVSPLLVVDWVTALAMERLQQKAERIDDWLQLYTGSWEEVCYISLARSLGFGANSDAFERLARSLPLRFLQKHADSQLQTEAFLFGQAGLLDEMIPDDGYYNRLVNEYAFLKNKFGLQPMDGTAWKFFRLRPANFPHQRIAVLAKFIQEGFSLFMCICEASTLKEWRGLFEIYLNGYWDTHYTFGNSSPEGRKTLGHSAVDILLINAVAPLLYAYGTKMGSDIHCDRAMQILEELKPEKNSIVEKFAQAGVKAKSALDSQALIQLHKMYCDPHKCISCRIGFKLLAIPK